MIGQLLLLLKFNRFGKVWTKGEYMFLKVQEKYSTEVEDLKIAFKEILAGSIKYYKSVVLKNIVCPWLLFGMKNYQVRSYIASFSENEFCVTKKKNDFPSAPVFK